MKIPGQFYRITKHKPPRHQLYFPGFNLGNSCWLEGDWVTMPKDEWEIRKDNHQRLFKKCRKEEGKQSHRGKGTPLAMLTGAQRLAYEHYSGDMRFDVRYENGNVGPVGVQMAGNSPQHSAAKWMRGLGMKIIRFVTTTGKTVDALEGLNVPADLVHEDLTPVDPWAEVVAQNIQGQVTMFYGCLESGDAFGFQMAMSLLVEKEKSVIRQEWNVTVGKKGQHDDIPREIEQYKPMRAKAKDVMGEAFTAAYESSRKTHNSCARSNLGDTGLLFSFVLPKFNDDGTHEPWGARDVPWGNRKR